MRYCECCKRKVGVKLTYGQLIVMIMLYCVMLLPGILYSCFHTRKCPICGAPTVTK